MKKVTIKDIAALFDISPHTVSKALNNRPGVSDELRRKIKEKAKELNYVPNVFGRGLSGKTTKTIGLVIPNDRNPAYAVILSGLTQKAAEAGYTIILSSSEENIHTEEKLIRMLLEKRVDGVILSPVAHPDAFRNVELLQRFGIPYVLMARTLENQEHPCVKANNVSGAYLAGQYLLRKGHSTVIYLTNKSSITAVKERIEGITQAFAEQGLAFPEKDIYRRCVVSIESGYTEMLDILRERRDFSAVFAYNDIIAYGVMKAVHECRLRIPNDVAIMGFDNLAFSEICLVPLTTVNQNLPAMGALSVEGLLSRIRGEENVPSLLMPVPYIVERQSV